MGGKLFVVSPTYEMIYVSSVWLGSQWMRSISFGNMDRLHQVMTNSTLARIEILFQSKLYIVERDQSNLSDVREVSLEKLSNPVY